MGVSRNKSGTTGWTMSIFFMISEKPRTTLHTHPCGYAAG